jgi:hypothetical protein
MITILVCLLIYLMCGMTTLYYGWVIEEIDGNELDEWETIVMFALIWPIALLVLMKYHWEGRQSDPSINIVEAIFKKIHRLYSKDKK